MPDQLLDPAGVRELIRTKFEDLSADKKAILPPVLRRYPIEWVHVDTPKFAMIIFIDDSDKTKLDEFKKSKLPIFPGLVAESEVDAPAMMALNNSRFIDLIGCHVHNAFTFKLGPDSLATLEDHHQILDDFGGATASYTIKLAYIISAGSTVEPSSALGFLGDLIAHSFKRWAGTG